jgi:hypothetical protein
MELESPLVSGTGFIQPALGCIAVTEGGDGPEVPGIQQEGGPAIEDSLPVVAAEEENETELMVCFGVVGAAGQYAGDQIHGGTQLAPAYQLDGQGESLIGVGPPRSEPDGPQGILSQVRRQPVVILQESRDCGAIAHGPDQRQAHEGGTNRVLMAAGQQPAQALGRPVLAEMSQERVGVTTVQNWADLFDEFAAVRVAENHGYPRTSPQMPIDTPAHPLPIANSIRQFLDSNLTPTQPRHASKLGSILTGHRLASLKMIGPLPQEVKKDP